MTFPPCKLTKIWYQIDWSNVFLWHQTTFKQYSNTSILYLRYYHPPSSTNYKSVTHFHPRPSYRPDYHPTVPHTPLKKRTYISSTSLITAAGANFVRISVQLFIQMSSALSHLKVILISVFYAMKLAISSNFICFDGCTFKNNTPASRAFENSTHSDATIKGKVNFLAEKQWKLKHKQKEKKEKQRKQGTRRKKRNHSFFISDLFFSFGSRRAFFVLIFVKKSRQFNRIPWGVLGSYLMKRKNRKVFLYHWHSVLRTMGKSVFTVIQKTPSDHTNSLTVSHKPIQFQVLNFTFKHARCIASSDSCVEIVLMTAFSRFRSTTRWNKVVVAWIKGLGQLFQDIINFHQSYPWTKSVQSYDH